MYPRLATNAGGEERGRSLALASSDMYYLVCVVRVVARRCEYAHAMEMVVLARLRRIDAL